MGDINFLSSSGKNDKKDKKAPLKKVEWTTPEKQKIGDKEKEKKSSLFSIFKNNNIENPREVVLKTIGEEKKKEEIPEKPKAFVFAAKEAPKVEKKIEPAKPKELPIRPEPKKPAPKPEVKKPEAKPLETKQIPVVKPAEKKPLETKIKFLDKEIDPKRINLFNRLIDYWRKRNKEKENKKVNIKAAELKPEIKEQKKEAKEAEGKVPQKEEKALDAKKKPLEGKILGSSHVLETNLMEGESLIFIDWHKNGVLLSLFILWACLMVAGVYGWLVLWGKIIDGQIISAESNIAEYSQSISQINKDMQEFSALEKKVKNLSLLLENHVHWTNFFKFLEDNTISDVYYQSFSGDISGGYKIPARARNFKSINEQAKTFERNDFVNSFDVSGGSLDKSGVTFELSMSVKPKLFNQAQ